MHDVRSEDNGYFWERNDKGGGNGFLVMLFFFPSLKKKNT